MPLSISAEIKRKRGAQPGNLNALKHGFYLNHSSLRGAAPFKSADLGSVSDAITAIREYIRRTAEVNLDHVTLEEVSEATRSLALAGLALVRLIAIQDLINSRYCGGQIPSLSTSSDSQIYSI